MNFKKRIGQIVKELWGIFKLYQKKELEKGYVDNIISQIEILLSL